MQALRQKSNDQWQVLQNTRFLKMAKKNKLRLVKRKKTLKETIENSSINFESFEQGVEVFAFAAQSRALSLANIDLQPRKLSNYIRSGFVQLSIINCVILHQMTGAYGISRDDLYDMVCVSYPATSFANFRKVLSIAVNSEILIRERDKSDSRRTIYRISDEMLEPYRSFFSSTMINFGMLFTEIFKGPMDDQELQGLMEYLSERGLIALPPKK